MLVDTGLQIESGVDALERRGAPRANLDGEIAITLYRGHGNDQIVNLQGRVLENKGLRRSPADDSLWDHL